jgi:outer membrane protein OmpA-like peptidoglycan-associated protein
MNTKRFLSITCAALILSVGNISCNSLKKLSREEKGAAIGVGTGGAVGAVIGSKSKNPAVYAIVGSAIGGVAGAVIGNYMDKQAKQLEKDLANVAEVERIDEGIKVTMSSGLLFGFDSYKLNEQNRENLTKLANTLNEYSNTEILVAGHTDNVGDDRYNEKLSDNRADAVADFLVSKGIRKSRLVVRGYGEDSPAYTNDTKNGQEKNRRVELAIVANESLKKDAKKGAK